MTKQTIIIDNLAFVKRNERLTGELTLVDLERWSSMLKLDAGKASNKFTPSASLQFVLSTAHDALGRALLTLSLQVSLNCLCQRCLSEMPLEFECNFNYLISDLSEQEMLSLALDDEDEVDLQPISQHMDVIALIEDELIMAMPIAPTHQQACTSAVQQSGEKPNPFAVLKTLIKP